MKVVVPYAPGKLHPVTKDVLLSYCLPVEFEKLTDDYAYSRLLKHLWDEGETVVIVEQDIVPWPGAVEELCCCVGLWCTHTYYHSGGIGVSHMLGCAKLSAELIQSLPGLWDEPVHWSTCDQHLFYCARGIRQEPHLHRPPVIHLKFTSAAGVPQSDENRNYYKG